jgi:hypothetical protein
MRQLYISGGIYAYFLAVMAVGWITYAASVLYFGPRNKFRVIKAVQQMMTNSPEEFKSDITEPPTVVGLTTAVRPTYRGQQPERRTFGDLELDENGIMAFRAGLSNWGLVHLWSYAEIKTARNVCESKHGIPFLRLARFGFLSSPTPKDLGGILNANAAYTFSTGIFQMLIGVVLLGAEGDFRLHVVLPLSISFCSLLLTAANIGLDFAGILNEVEAENRLKDTIKDRNDARMASQKKRLKQASDARMNALEVEYQHQRGPVAQKEKQERRAAEFNSYMMDVANIDEESAEELRGEIYSYQRRLQMTKDAASGILKHDRVDFRNGLQEFESRVAPLQSQLEKIDDDRQRKIEKVDHTLHSDEYEREVNAIDSEHGKKRQIIEIKIEDIKMSFRGGAGVYGAPSV